MLKNVVDEENFYEFVKCPYCSNFQKKMSTVRTWFYGNVKVTRFECQCGKNFNFYKSKSTSWIIPKNPHKKSRSEKNVK